MRAVTNGIAEDCDDDQQEQRQVGERINDDDSDSVGSWSDEDVSLPEWDENGRLIRGGPERRFTDDSRFTDDDEEDDSSSDDGVGSARGDRKENSVVSAPHDDLSAVDGLPDGSALSFSQLGAALEEEDISALSVGNQSPSAKFHGRWADSSAWSAPSSSKSSRRQKHHSRRKGGASKYKGAGAGESAAWMILRPTAVSSRKIKLPSSHTMTLAVHSDAVLPKETLREYLDTRGATVDGRGAACADADRPGLEYVHK